jgi:hypothetical protein
MWVAYAWWVEIKVSARTHHQQEASAETSADLLFARFAFSLFEPDVRPREFPDSVNKSRAQSTEFAGEKV